MVRVNDAVAAGGGRREAHKRRRRRRDSSPATSSAAAPSSSDLHQDGSGAAQQAMPATRAAATRSRPTHSGSGVTRGTLGHPQWATVGSLPATATTKQTSTSSLISGGAHRVRGLGLGGCEGWD